VGIIIVGVGKSYDMMRRLGHSFLIVLFAIFFWTGVITGSIISFSFFKKVRSVKIRGLICCVALIPICLFTDFLMWSF